MKHTRSYFALAGLCLLALLLGGAARVIPRESVQVPIIMYHSLAGGGHRTCISGTDFEADLRYLREEGYQAVTITDLVHFVHHGKPLPERPVVLSFDDGYQNNYTVGLPLAQKYEMPFVLAVIGKHTELWSENPSQNLRDGHVTWAEIREMVGSGLVEILNHSWDLHEHTGDRYGVAMRPGEDRDHYRALLQKDLEKLQRELTTHAGVTPVGFVYPFGKLCSEAAEVLVEAGFLAALTCRDGINTLVYGEPDGLLQLRRYERTPERPICAIL